MKFRKDNKIAVLQDHRFFEGIPSGVDFRVQPWSSGFWLTAKGYGEKGDYGNGALIVLKITPVQRKRFERYVD